MKVIVMANVEQQREIASKNTNPDAELVFVKSFPEFEHDSVYDAIFYHTEHQFDMDL
jgi:hypothetical protein